MTLALPDIYVLRHGETEWNRAGRIQGWADSRLTELGQAQAKHQGLILTSLGVSDLAVRVSPLGRTRATATLALPDRDPTEFTADARLKEINVGRWQGMTRPEMAADMPKAFQGKGVLGWYDKSPDGERLADLEARCRAVLAELNAPTILVTHGITSRMMRLVALGLHTDDLEAVPGGQGVVHAILGGKARVFD